MAIVCDRLDVLLKRQHIPVHLLNAVYVRRMDITSVRNEKMLHKVSHPLKRKPSYSG